MEGRDWECSFQGHTKHIRDREVDNNSFSSTHDEEKTNDVSLEDPANEFLWDNPNVKESNRASNWRAAIGTAALKARQHLLERENRQRDVVEDISAMSIEEKNNYEIEEPAAFGDRSDIVTMEESTNTEEIDDCDQPLADNSTKKDSNNVVTNSCRATNWKNVIGSAFRIDFNAEKLALEKSIVCQ